VYAIETRKFTLRINKPFGSGLTNLFYEIVKGAVGVNKKAVKNWTPAFAGVTDWEYLYVAEGEGFEPSIPFDTG
jgi:hypothetical protein